MIDVEFEVAREQDVAQILAFIRRFNSSEGYPFRENVAREALSRLVGDPSLGRAWLIRAGATAIGYVVLTLGYSIEFHGRDAFVDELFVEPEYRSQGVGTRALEFVAREARTLGVRALHLEAERSNDAAMAVYRRSGFKDHDRILMTRWLEGEP